MNGSMLEIISHFLPTFQIKVLMIWIIIAYRNEYVNMPPVIARPHQLAFITHQLVSFLCEMSATNFVYNVKLLAI